MKPALPEITEPLILALDIGTSSVRAMLFDAQGRAVPEIESRYRLSIEIDRGGAFETDPDALLEITFQAIDDVIAKTGTLAQRIAGVCACTFVSNVLGIDATGRAVTPLVLYADTRAAPDARALAERLDEAACHQRTGTRFHASYLPARLLWWQREYPAQYAQVWRWISFHEYLLLHLFGEAAASYSVASWTGLLDRAQLIWDAALLHAIGVEPEQLSPLVDADFTWSGLRPAFAARWPALAHTRWFPAIGDGAAANLGSGCATPGQVAISMGTSSAARAVIRQPDVLLPPGLWCYRVDRRRALLGGAMNEGGSIFAWLRRLLNLQGIEDLEAALADVPPAEHGLTVLPLITGERSPGWVSDARAAITGLSLATTPLDLLRAGLEGVGCRVALVYHLLRSVLPGEPKVIGSGGALQNSPVMQQILADALGCPLYVSAVQETSTRGAALLALEALRTVEDLSRLPDEAVLAAEPRREAHHRYQEMMAQQAEIYQKLVLKI